MPLGPLAEGALPPILESVLQLFCYGTSWILVPIFTFVTVYVEPTPLREFVKPKFGRIQRSSNGHYIMKAELASLLGILFWNMIAIGAYVFFKYT